MSKLTEVSVYPKPRERRGVATCLRVFCEETATAIVNHPGMRNVDGREHTAAFIKIVVNLWKILNVKSIGVDVRFNNKLQAVVQDPLDERLNTILQFGEMALHMKAGQGKRYKQFTRDTAQAIHHTCKCIVNLCRFLLRVSHNYVLLGTFSTDPLEKEFGKLRQGSGGIYFITLQQIIEKMNISKASLLLSANVNVDNFNIESGHSCFNCSFLLDENSAEIFDGL